MSREKLCTDMNGHYRDKEGFLKAGRATTFGEIARKEGGVEDGGGGKKTPEEEWYQRLIHVEQHPNGGATVVHIYQDEICTLSSHEIQQLAHVFFK